MKTLTEMKKVCRINRFSFLIVAISIVIGFSSCGNDDDSKIPVFSTKDVEGSYTGKMLIASLQPQSRSTGENTEGVDITAEVKDCKLFFNKFPVADLVKSIVGEEAAADVIKALGDIKYEVDFEAKFDENKNDVIKLKFAPKPLEIKFELPAQVEGQEPAQFNVKATITATQGIFTYATKKLELSLHATEVTINEQPLDGFQPTTFTFNLTKK